MTYSSCSGIGSGIGSGVGSGIGSGVGSGAATGVIGSDGSELSLSPSELIAITVKV